MTAGGEMPDDTYDRKNGGVEAGGHTSKKFRGKVDLPIAGDYFEDDGLKTASGCRRVN